MDFISNGWDLFSDHKINLGYFYLKEVLSIKINQKTFLKLPVKFFQKEQV